MWDPGFDVVSMAQRSWRTTSALRRQRGLPDHRRLLAQLSVHLCLCVSKITRYLRDVASRSRCTLCSPWKEALSFQGYFDLSEDVVLSHGSGAESSKELW